MPLFVISSEYLAKTLMNFWHTRHFCRNLPFSPKFATLLLWSPFVKIPLFVTSVEVLPNLWWILAQFPVFLNLPFSRKSPIVNMPLLVSHLIFSRPLHVMNPLPNSIAKNCANQIKSNYFNSHGQFRKICHFRKTYNYQHASFVILLTFLPNLSFS